MPNEATEILEERLSVAALVSPALPLGIDSCGVI